MTFHDTIKTKKNIIVYASRYTQDQSGDVFLLKTLYFCVTRLCHLLNQFSYLDWRNLVLCLVRLKKVNLVRRISQRAVKISILSSIINIIGIYLFCRPRFVHETFCGGTLPSAPPPPPHFTTPLAPRHCIRSLAGDILQRRRLKILDFLLKSEALYC